MIAAGQVMRTSVISVSPEDTLDQVLDIFIKHGISGVPVVDETNKLVGIITEKDLINFTSKEYAISRIDSSGWVSPYTELKGSVKIKEGFELLNKTTVRNVMTKRVCTVNEQTPIKDVAFKMNKKKFNQLPVINREGKLIGIITRTHLIRHMAMEGHMV